LETATFYDEVENVKVKTLGCAAAFWVTKQGYATANVICLGFVHPVAHSGSVYVGLCSSSVDQCLDDDDVEEASDCRDCVEAHHDEIQMAFCGRS
jgi:hypothetical protein